MSQCNGQEKRIGLEIKDLDAANNSGLVDLRPASLVVDPGDWVVWEFDGFLPPDYRLDIALVSFTPDAPEGADPISEFEKPCELTANGNRVASDTWLGLEGTYSYSVSLQPVGDSGEAITLSSESAEREGDLQEGPPPAQPDEDSQEECEDPPRDLQEGPPPAGNVVLSG